MGGGSGSSDLLKMAAIGGLAATGFGAAGIGPLAGAMGAGAGAGALGAGEAAGLGAGGAAGLFGPEGSLVGGAMGAGPGAATTFGGGMGSLAAGGAAPAMNASLLGPAMNAMKPQQTMPQQAPAAPGRPMQAPQQPTSFASGSPFMQPWWQGTIRR